MAEILRLLDRLKLEWIVYAFAVAILSLFQDGFDSDSLLSAALRVAITFALASYVTRSLDQRSSLIWAFGVTFGLLGATAMSMRPNLFGFGLAQSVPFIGMLQAVPLVAFTCVAPIVQPFALVVIGVKSLGQPLAGMVAL